MNEMLEIQPPEGFSWYGYHAYKAFDMFLESVVLQRKSFISREETPLEIENALNDIRNRFSADFDGAEKNFSEKAEHQFENASENTKLFFANAEYLWAMPSSRIKVESKRVFALRWFDDASIKDTEDVYFTANNGIGNPGSWYQTNKYFELLAVFRILSCLCKDKTLTDVSQVKTRVEELCYEGIYENPESHGGFEVTKKCAVHPALLHLAAPDRYESIFSEGHKNAIVGVFSHVIADRSDISCREQKIRLIRQRIYPDYGVSSDSFAKYRWFFYIDDVQRVWRGKKNRNEQTSASIKNEVAYEENPIELTEVEGERIPLRGYCIHRSATLANQAKARDNYTCKACGFSFKKMIVQIHHLDPISERNCPRETTAVDLVTLCPNCHYLAHYFLRKSDRYKKEEDLLNSLRALACRSNQGGIEDA